MDNLIALGLTLIIEFVVIYLLTRKTIYGKKLIYMSIILNILTNVPLNLLLNLIKNNLVIYIILLITLEIIIILIEGTCYYFIIKSKKKALFISLIANLSSFLLGSLLMSCFMMII